MKKKWKVITCIVLAVVILGGSLVAWLLYVPPDTDPSAPFQDLSSWEKRQILAAIKKYYETDPPSPTVCWYGEPTPAGGYRDNYNGIQYYGTFEGYHILMSPRPGVAQVERKHYIYVAGCSFSSSDRFMLFAYKNGKVMTLEDAYLNPLSKEQIQKIYQCFERYRPEIYSKAGWEEYHKHLQHQKTTDRILVCSAVVVLAGVGIGAFRVYRKRRAKDTQQSDS